MDFTDKELVVKHGTWVKVQVAFYDFIFHEASKMCPEHFNNAEMQDIVDGFAEGEDLYEASVREIEGKFKTPHEAWEAFKINQKG